MNKQVQKTAGQAEKKNGISRSQKVKAYVLLFFFVLVGCPILIARLYDLQVNKHEEFKIKVANQQLMDTSIKPQRGQIYDANGKVLAKSSIVWNVVADPSQIKAPRLTKKELEAFPDETEPEESRVRRREARIAQTSSDVAQMLGLEYEDIYNKLIDEKRQYVVLAKQVDKPVADQIREYASKNKLTISVSSDTKREYPYGAFAASVLGFMHADGYGFYGLEKQYDDVLAGTPGRLVSLRNNVGAEVANDNWQEYRPEDGNSLVLTLVTQIQAIVEKYLENSVKANNVTERSMAIVMDVNTGAILAMASKPDFDPNQPMEIYDPSREALLEGLSDEEYTKVQGAERQRQWKNKAITELYSPGSVFKVITAASALDSGAITTGSSFRCEPGGYQVAGTKPYRCAENKAHGIVTINDIIYNSCNQGIIQVAQRMGKDVFSDYYNAFGLTEPTGIDLPAEQRTKAGVSYYDPAKMSGVDLASSSFGQAMSVTPIQMITAISAAVNGGYLVQPHIVSRIVDKDGNLVKEINPTPKRQVISEEVSAQVRKMMEHAVDYGAPGAGGRNAYVAGYHIGGKSGTTEKLNEPMRADGDYEKVSSFVAVVPANDPQIAILAFLDEPHANTDFGSMLSAPLVGNMISEIAPYLGLETDASLLPKGEVKVPDLVNAQHREWDMAQVELNKLGLDHRRVGGGPIVLAQYPVADTMVPGGTTVYLYTDSADIRKVPVPDVKGKSAPLASQMLAGAGLNVKLEGPEEGIITAQDVTGGSEVPMGTLVTLTSEEPSAPEPEPEPEPEPSEAPQNEG